MKDLPETGALPPSLTEVGLSNYAPYLMNRIMGRYNAAVRAEMAGLGLTTPKMRALAVLTVVERPLIRELAAYAVVEQSTLSRALDGLAIEGLVQREADAADGRGTRVSITADGRAAFKRLWPHMAAATEAMFHSIDEEERGAFVATLRKLLANVSRHET